VTAKTAVIAGAGGVLGHALVREFATAGYTVVALQRGAGESSADRAIQRLCCDLSDATDVAGTLTKVGAEHGAVDTLIHNAAQLVVAPFAELKPADFEAAWRTSVLGAVACAQAVLPGMVQHRRGALIFSGATASIRGGARFAAFAAAKFALRGLAQSLAREYHAQGVHVAHVVPDGLLRGSKSVERFGGSDAQAIDPVEIAKTYRWLAEQERSAWTHELDLRPASEKF